uniref:Uncharacterized protein n=1 Tax=Labrus bergylta TaxID=56723 RepID=A0A3Q3NMW2_9LABR
TGQITFAAALLSCRCQATHLSVLVHSLCDPLGVWVASDGLVEDVDQDHLKELVGGVLANPVGAQHTQSSAVTPGTLLRKNTEKELLIFTEMKPELRSSLCSYQTNASIMRQ